MVEEIVIQSEAVGVAADAPFREPVLEVSNLVTEFAMPNGSAVAVNGVSFRINTGETVCIVGESGSGKSVTALSIMRLLATPPARIRSGSVMMDGRDLLTLSEQEMSSVRGNRISMIFQEPMTSLNPVLTVGFQISEVVRRHQGLSRKQAWERAIEMLSLVRIPEPQRRVDEYPHQLSGGMRQRVMIAMALSCGPQLLIADEPTTALDVTIQAQVMELIRDLRERTGTAVLLITHDLGLVAENADRVVVMYGGRKVEEASVRELFARPAHPYTKALLRSMPRMYSSVGGGASMAARLTEIPGIVPALTNLPGGCAFADRCDYAVPVCKEAVPPYELVSAQHGSACWRIKEVMEEA